MTRLWRATRYASILNSRYFLSATGILMITMGLFPKLGAVIDDVPRPALAGVGAVILEMTIAAGIQEMSCNQFDGTRNGHPVVVSVGLDILPAVFLSLFDRVHGVLGLLLRRSAVHCGFTAVSLGIFCNFFTNELTPKSPEISFPSTELAL